MANPKLIVTPFADIGTKNDIPESGATEPQLATMSAGFPAITQTPINEGGKPPERADFNGLGYLTTSHLAFLNRGQTYGFDPVAAAQFGGYPLHARLQLDNGDIVQSTIPNNTNNPNSNMSGWENKNNINAEKVVDESGLNQQEINDGLESVGDLILLSNPVDGNRQYVKSYWSGLNIGGDLFIYDQARSGENDGATIFNGWGRQFTDLTVSKCGAKGGSNDDVIAFQRANTLAFSLKKQLVIDIDIRVSAPTPLGGALNIRGNGGVFQNGRSITVTGNHAVFEVQPGFVSQCCKFSDLTFKSLVGGQGTAFKSIDFGYFAQTTFNNVTFDKSLRYGLDANIILCRFYDCDFGTFESVENNVGFKAIRSYGDLNLRNPNANTFYTCTFRNGNDDCVIDYTGYGTQWNYYSCDFEQNKSTDCIIKAQATGSIMFSGGYIEANITPYFIRTYGSQSIGVVNLVQFNGVFFHHPVLTAIAKNDNPNYPKFELTGAYGPIECALWESSTGSLNDVNLLSSAIGNELLILSGGSSGRIAVTSQRNDYNFPKIRSVSNSKVGNWTAVTAQGVALATVQNINNTSYSLAGELLITTMTGLTMDSNEGIATYKYLVTRGSAGTNVSLTLVAKSGLTEGLSVLQPSFTFSINASGQILATPFGSTAGAGGGFFSFEITGSNNLNIV